MYRLAAAPSGCPAAPAPVTYPELWTLRATAPTIHDSHVAAALPDGSVLAAGGIGSNAAEVYRPVTNTWLPAPPMAGERQSAVSVTLPDGDILVIGGFQHATEPLAACATVSDDFGGPTGYSDLANSERYDVATGTWSLSINCMSIGRSRYHAAALLGDGRVAVIGGVHQYGLHLANVDIYTPSTNSWSPGPALPATRVLHTATALADGRILVAGGYSGGVVNDYLVFDGTSWSAPRPLPGYRWGHAVVRLASGKLLLTAGTAGLGPSNRWPIPGSTIPRQTRGRSSRRCTMPAIDHRMVALDDGTVLVAGGCAVTVDACDGEPADQEASSERWSLADGWTVEENLNVPRLSSTLTALPGAAALSVGGRDAMSHDVATTELYDEPCNLLRNPGAEMQGLDPWTTGGTLLFNPAAGTASLSPGGAIGATGGTGWFRAPGSSDADVEGFIEQTVDVHAYGSSISSGTVSATYGGDSFALSDRSPPAYSTNAFYTLYFLDEQQQELGHDNPVSILPGQLGGAMDQQESPDSTIGYRKTVLVPPNTVYLRFRATASEATFANTVHGFDNLFLSLSSAAGGGCDTPPPTGTPTPTANHTPIPTPDTPTPTVSPTATPSGAALPGASGDPSLAPGYAVALPALSFLGSDDTCQAWVQVQNAGQVATRAILLAWGEWDTCANAPGPLGASCSGLIAPGSAWSFEGSGLPNGARSGLVYSVADGMYNSLDIGDTLCAHLSTAVTTAAAYRAFQAAYLGGGTVAGIPMSAARGELLAVAVRRSCPADQTPGADVSSAYEGIAETMQQAHFTPGQPDYRYQVPLVVADSAGTNTFLYLQNTGLDCAAVTLAFRAQDSCLPATVCVLGAISVPPGQVVSFDPLDCVGSDWTGSVEVRSDMSLAIVADLHGRDALSTYRGVSAVPSPGADEWVGPLYHSPTTGWDTLVQVQNLGTGEAEARVTFYDHTGAVEATLSDTICPGAAAPFLLPVSFNAPVDQTGWIRVESLPDGGGLRQPVAAMAWLIKYSDAQRTDVREASAYNLLPARELASGRADLPFMFRDLEGCGLTSEVQLAGGPQFGAGSSGTEDIQHGFFDPLGSVAQYILPLTERESIYEDLSTVGSLPNGLHGSLTFPDRPDEHVSRRRASYARPPSSARTFRATRRPLCRHPAAGAAVRTVPSGMVGWWPFDEADGTIAHDVSPFYHDGTKVGSSPTWHANAGHVQGAIEFMRLPVGELIRVPHTAELDLGTGNEFSIDAWLMFPEGSDPSIFNYLLGKRRFSGAQNGGGQQGFAMLGATAESSSICCRTPAPPPITTTSPAPSFPSASGSTWPSPSSATGVSRAFSSTSTACRYPRSPRTATPASSPVATSPTPSRSRSAAG